MTSTNKLLSKDIIHTGTLFQSCHLQLWRVSFVVSGRTVTLSKSFWQQTEAFDPKHYREHRQGCGQMFQRGRVGKEEKKLQWKNKGKLQIALMHIYESDWLVLPPSLAFEVQTCKFYHEWIPKAAKMKGIPMWELRKGGRGSVENNIRKQGLVVNFEHRTSQCISQLFEFTLINHSCLFVTT